MSNCIIHNYILINAYMLKLYNINPPLHVYSTIATYFKHSCNPNVFCFTNDGKNIAFSIKPIKKGEQLFISCAPTAMDSTTERQKFLSNIIKMECKCARCQGITANPAQREQLVSDPEFQYIDANVVHLQPLIFNFKQIKPLIIAFVEVLRKYGRMEWCDELNFIFEWFKSLLNIRSIGGGMDFDHRFVKSFLTHCDGECKCSNCKVD